MAVSEPAVSEPKLLDAPEPGASDAGDADSEPSFRTGPPPKRERYRVRHPVRIVTAASLFDGHDAAINVMRRILQASGAEVIHLGHNRSVAEIVDCAIQEDAQGDRDHRRTRAGTSSTSST